MVGLPARGAREPHPSGTSLHRSLIEAMMEPSFYPHRPPEVTHRETHISHLFFAGDLVYKVKKPVRFSFLDYATLKRRRYFLYEELRLNRRLAPSVYLGVLPISHGPYGWELGVDVHPVEYALVMRRLPENRMLAFLLEHDQATPSMMSSLAEILARFHAQAAIGEEINASGDPRVIEKVWEENLADIRPFVGRLLDTETYQTIADFGRGFLEKKRDLFLRRISEGRIREGHGDLHCEHVCFAPEGIQIFDCVEFSSRLRCCDVASELAFLIMDMEFRGAKELARLFLKRYLELIDDQELPILLPFYKCYRAVVRGKVEALRTAGASPQAARYLAFARRITWEAYKPFLVLISGLTGSGKSTLAAELGQRLGLAVISSDATRKALAKGPRRRHRVPYEEGIYSPAMTERTYAKLAEKAAELVLEGEGAIVDATFHRRAYREPMWSFAARDRIPVVLIQCQPAEDIVQERLIRREQEGRDLSDGRWEVYLKQKERFEPPKEFSPELCLTLDTAEAPSELVRQVERFLRRALAQIAPS